MVVLVRAFLIVALALPVAAWANRDLPKAHQQTVEAQVLLRGWSQKGFGEQIGVTKITVITAPDLRGDIVILRWNKESIFFTTEAYRQDESLSSLSSWESIDPRVDKSIALQPGGRLHISELIEGKDGGQRIEVLVLEGKE